MKTTEFFKIIIITGLILLLVPLTTALSPGTTTYSFVHISDTQNLATHYPDTYDLTFSYLESIKTQYNISAIILTGDLVNTWDKKSEWDAYSHARNMTNIPLYVTAGNHDTNYGKNYKYYSMYTGEEKGNYVTSLHDFDFVGINYVDKSLSPQEFTALRQAIVNRSHNFTIIATHYYMGKTGTLSTLGKDIERQLIVQPTIILAGHIHGKLIRVKNISGFPVIEDLTNYQNGEPGGVKNQNYSAGTFYTVTVVDGQVVKIISETIHIFPEQSFKKKMVLYDITGQFSGSLPAPVSQVNLSPVIPPCVWPCDLKEPAVQGFRLPDASEHFTAFKCVIIPGSCSGTITSPSPS
ncbi:MAG: metallophosphoesterase [Methanoregula sp.]|nr:metallophosphoesterase [Methanoregula sp.]